jgi:hypothetical protein
MIKLFASRPIDTTGMIGMNFEAFELAFPPVASLWKEKGSAILMAGRFSELNPYRGMPRLLRRKHAAG